MLCVLNEDELSVIKSANIQSWFIDNRNMDMMLSEITDSQIIQ